LVKTRASFADHGGRDINEMSYDKRYHHRMVLITSRSALETICNGYCKTGWFQTVDELCENLCAWFPCYLTDAEFVKTDHSFHFE
jgi:hypothetical protein